MLNSSRAALAIGLGLVGVAGFVAPLLGQDPALRQAGTGTGTGAAAADAAKAAPKPSTPAIVATMDINKVLKDYDKFRASYETFTAEAMAKEAELRKIEAEARQQNEVLQKLAQGSLDQKKISEKITLLIAQFEAGKKSAQAEFAQKDAEMMATIYNEIQQMAAGIAKSRGYTMVVRYSSAPASGSDPDSIRAVMANAVVFADPKIDITPDMIKWLNYYYYQKGGQKPKGNADANAASATNPANGPTHPQAAAPTATQPR
jgi:Skp family chaperone for outer membrane proteins